MSTRGAATAAPLLLNTLSAHAIVPSGSGDHADEVRMALRDFVVDTLEDGFLAASARALKRARGAAPAFFSTVSIGSKLWSDWSFERAVRQAFRVNETVARCLRIRANALSSIPPTANRRLADGSLERLPAAHAAARFAAKPNPRLSWAQIMYRASFAVDLKGSLVCFVNDVNAKDGAIELWPLPPHQVSIRPKSIAEIEVIHQVGSDEKTKKTYTQEQVAIISQYDPLDEWNGIATLRPVARRVDTGNSIQSAQKFSFDNLMLPSGFVSGDLSEKQQESIRKQIEDTKKGPKGFRKMIIARTRIFFESLMGNPAEMDFAESTELIDKKTAMGLGVHPVLLGVSEATFENQRMAEVFLWTNETIPVARLILDAFNTQIAPRFGDDIVFGLDLSQSPPTIENQRMNARISQYYRDLGINLRAINRRLALGFADNEVPDISVLPANLMEVDRGLSRTRQIRGARLIARAINLDEEAIDHRWFQLDRKKRAYEDAIARQVRSRFLEEEEFVATQILAGNRNVAAMITEQEDSWRNLLRAMAVTVVERMGNDVADEIAGGGQVEEGERSQTRFDAFTGAVRAFIDQHVAEQVQKISRKTTAALKTVVEGAVAEGATSGVIAANVRGLYSRWVGEDEDLPFDRSRSYTIAQTEVHTMTGYASREAALQSTIVTGKRWVSSRDSEVRDEHVDMDTGTVIPINEPYPNGLMYPGDPSGSAEEVIKCRCQEVYVTVPLETEGLEVNHAVYLSTP